MLTALQTIMEHPDFPRRSAWWREDFGPGQSIVTEADTTRDLFLLESGRVRIDKQVEGADAKQLQSSLLELGPGDIFGELCLFGDVTRSATVVGLEKGVFVHIDGQLLAEFMEKHLELGYALLKEFFIHHAVVLSSANQRYGSLYARQAAAKHDGEADPASA